MSWEKRRDSKSKYMYRSIRKDGKVTKQYIGSERDSVARLVDQQLRLDRAEKIAWNQELQSEQNCFQQCQTTLNTLRRHVRHVLQVCMWAEGVAFKEGHWERMSQDHQLMSEEVTTDTSELPTKETFQRLVRQAQKGDRDAAEQLQRIVRNREEIWGPYADLNRHVEVTLIAMISGEDLVLRESLRSKLDNLKNSIRGRSDNPIDGLLVDQIMIAWLELLYTQMATLQAQDHQRDSVFWEARYGRAHSRYLAAVRELVDIREILGDRDGASFLREVVIGNNTSSP